MFKKYQVKYPNNWLYSVFERLVSLDILLEARV